MQKGETRTCATCGEPFSAVSTPLGNETKTEYIFQKTDNNNKIKKEKMKETNQKKTQRKKGEEQSRPTQIKDSEKHRSCRAHKN